MKDFRGVLLVEYRQLVFGIFTTVGLGALGLFVASYKNNEPQFLFLFITVLCAVVLFILHTLEHYAKEPIITALKKKIREQEESISIERESFRSVKYLMENYEVLRLAPEVIEGSEFEKYRFALDSFTENDNYSALTAMNINPLLDVYNVVYYEYEKASGILKSKTRVLHPDHLATLTGRDIEIRQGQIGTIFAEGENIFVNDLNGSDPKARSMCNSNSRDYDRKLYKSIAGVIVNDEQTNEKIGVLAVTTNKIGKFTRKSLDILDMHGRFISALKKQI